MMSAAVLPFGGSRVIAGSVLGIARDADEGALRALCQVCSTVGVTETRKNPKCVLVTIYRRESDLFALRLREWHNNGSPHADGGGGGGGGGGARGRRAGQQAPGLTVLCDMALDDGVHLEHLPHGAPLVVKVVNTCRQKNAYLLEFGRKVDLATFQRAFTAARGYFRQMLTLRSLVADSFWQGFASGAGGAVRNEPHGSPSEALKPPPGVVPGTPQAGLRGKTDGPGARGLDAEALAAKIFGFYSAAEGGDGGASSPRARSPGTKSSGSFSRGFRAGGGGGGGGGRDDAGAGSWGAAVAAAATRRGGGVDKQANAEYNFSCVDHEGKNCHKCQHNAVERPGIRFECPNGRPSHVYCARCLERTFSSEGAKDLLLEGSLRYVCPVCEGFCPCKKCDGGKPRGPRIRKQSNGGGVADHDEGADADATKPLSLVQELPAPQLSHYEGLFAKYLQSLPALERVSTTEDVCFLCKEGGNLVECDKDTSWYHRVKTKREALGKPPPLPGAAFSSCGVPMEDGGAGDAAAAERGGAPQGGKKAYPHPPRCKKVYHAYCMGFNVADDELSTCPRHACVDCAEAAAYFCRFCPVSLCGQHFRSDPSGIVAETYESLQHRVRRPFPRTRGGGFRRPRAPAPPPAAASRGGSGAKDGRHRGRGRGRGRGGGGGGGRKRPRGQPSGDNIAHNRPRRGQAPAPVPAPRTAVAGTGTGTGRRDDGRGGGTGVGRGGSGGSGGGVRVRDKRSSGVGEAGGAGFGENDFVCTGCKMAARRAVRQYGLMGSLETGGVVLPYGESEESGDENESDVKPITALCPRGDGNGAASPFPHSSSPPAAPAPAPARGAQLGEAGGTNGDDAKPEEEQPEAKGAGALGEGGSGGRGGSGGGSGGIGSPKVGQGAGAGGVDGTDRVAVGEDGVGGGGGSVGGAAPAGNRVTADTDASATANTAAAAVAANKYFSMFSRRDCGGGTEQDGGSAAESNGGGAAGCGGVEGGGDGGAGSPQLGGGCVEGGGSDVEMG